MPLAQILHSDQCRNFESTMLCETLKAFGVEKSRTTAYHLQDDGMVERFNRSLLQLLRSYVESQNNWERYLPLVLYVYRTATHYSMGDPSFMLMFGGFQVLPQLTQTNAIDATSYLAHLTTKIVELQDLVESNLAAAAKNQKTAYDSTSCTSHSQPETRYGCQYPRYGCQYPW